MIKLRNACFLAILLLFCCRKPYNPPASSTTNSYLVVEGVINSGSDSTIIKLSKTVKLNAGVTINPLPGATVTVEGSQSSTWPLADDGKGNYISTGLNLSSSQQYRLRIRTADGSQYVSDFEPVKPTPPIDSIGFIIQNDGVQLYVNAHDPANNTRYYRWDYQETWIFHADYLSLSVLDTNTNKIVYRRDDQKVYFCFAHGSSSSILLGSTAKLTQDVVYQGPITKIPLSSEKLESKYSILLRQYALTPDAYTFYTNLKKNTEQLGSIFDAQPSQLTGNIHNVADAGQPVIGFITVTNVQSKRIFIPSTELPANNSSVYPYKCEQDTALLADKDGFNQAQNILITPPRYYEATVPLSAPGGGIYAYLYSTPICMDCTLRGFTQTPPFWK